MAKPQTIEEKAAEMLENGAFLFDHETESGRSVYRYERTGRNGRAYGADRDHEAYLLTVSGTGIATVVWSCSCPASQRMAEEGDGERCKHVFALEKMLKPAPVVIEPELLTTRKVSGWGLIGLGGN